MLKIVLSIFIIFISFHQFAQTSKLVIKLDKEIQKFTKKTTLPGFATCVVKDDSIIYSYSYGKANIENEKSMTIDGLMNIGSISKTFTTTAIMQLWEKDLVDLQANINKYLDFEIKNPNHTDSAITIFQLLTHTSSIRDSYYYDDSYSLGDPTLSLNDWIYNYFSEKGKYYSKEDNFDTEAPGQSYKYSNVGFGIIGLIVENISKVKFNKYCKENIFTPLGMLNTGWYLSEIDTALQITPYYYLTKDNINNFKNNSLITNKNDSLKIGDFTIIGSYSFPNYPDGLVRTSIRELSYFLTAMMNGGKYKEAQILKEETIKFMFSKHIKIGNGQGLCWYSPVSSVWAHTGGDPGISTNLSINMESRTGLIYFTNCNKEMNTMPILKQWLKF